MVRRAISDPFYLLQGIIFIGDHNEVSKNELFAHLSQFTDKEKKEIKKSKSDSGITDDVLFNLKILQFATDDSQKISLTSLTTNPYINLFSGTQVYQYYKNQDKQESWQMIQTNSLFFSPEIRALATFVLKKMNSVADWEIGSHFMGKTVFGHKFNSFTLPTALSQLEKLEIIKKNKTGDKAIAETRYSLLNLHTLIFCQLLIEEFNNLKQVDDSVSYSLIKEHFALKFNIAYSDFEEKFSIVRSTLIPNLITTGSYEKFSLRLDIARELNLYE